jgi:hypothetical protein
VPVAVEVGVVAVVGVVADEVAVDGGEVAVDGGEVAVVVDEGEFADAVAGTPAPNTAVRTASVRVRPQCMGPN